MPLTILDLIGTPGTDVVLEGPQIAEFCDVLESLPVQQDVSMLSRFRRADRIIGRDGHVNGAVGYVLGRSWIVSYVQLPRYRCHKEVRALKIKEIRTEQPGGPSSMQTSCCVVIVPEESDYAPFEVSAEYCRKHNPQPGGYFVVYNDGYQSWSPAKAFEEGYTRI